MRQRGERVELRDIFSIEPRVQKRKISNKSQDKEKIIVAEKKIYY